MDIGKLWKPEGLQCFIINVAQWACRGVVKLLLIAWSLFIVGLMVTIVLLGVDQLINLMI